MFMRFLGIGIGHRCQHTTVEPDPAIDTTDDFQTCVNIDEESNDIGKESNDNDEESSDKQNDDEEESADFDSEDEEDEDLVDEEDIDCDDEDLGYGDL